MLESAAVYEGDYHDCYSVRTKAKSITASIRLGATTKYLTTATPRTLDIGCSVGATVRVAQDLGWDAMGVDISQGAIDYCRTQGLECHKIEGLDLPFRDGSFDLVTNWHVIEHCENVTDTLAEWYRVLKPGGVMILETPDSTCMKARLLGPKYEKFWPAEHLYTFDPINLSSLLKKSSFEILPMRLIGKPLALPAYLTLYALAYRSLRYASRAFHLCKSLEIICRRPLAESAPFRAA